MRQRIDKRIRRRIIGLTRSAQHARRRGKQHECSQLLVPGQLVQMPGGIDLGRKYLVDPLRTHRIEDTVVDHPRHMDDRRQRVLGINPGKQLAQRTSLAHVAGGHRDTGPRRRKLLPQRIRAPRARAQKQMPNPVPRNQVPRNQRTQRTRATRDQHRPCRIQRWRGFRYSVGLRCDAFPDQSRRAELVLAQPQLRLLRAKPALPGLLRHRTRIDVEQRQPTGVLGLR
jgi:hypothetical protein